VDHLVDQGRLKGQGGDGKVSGQPPARPADPASVKPTTGHKGAMERPGHGRQPDLVQPNSIAELLLDQLTLGLGEWPDHSEIRVCPFGSTHSQCHGS
jgi:hypothetical protein